MSIKSKNIFHTFLKFGLIPTGILIVVVFQLYNTKQGLTPWKGGGFGMYSTYHSNETQLYINKTYYNSTTMENNDNKIAIKSYLFFPNKKNLDALIQSFNLTTDTLNIQIWQPHLDTKTLIYSRKLKYEYRYIKPAH